MVRRARSVSRIEEEEATRERLGRLENLMQQLSEKIDSLCSGQESRTNGGSDHEMRQPQQQMNRNHGDYQPPTRFCKLEFPRFQRSDMEGWILKCDQYFQLDGTPEDRKITMVSLQLDEKAYLWHSAFMDDDAARGVRWLEYKQALRMRFGRPCESPMGDLKRLRQLDSLEEYNDEFDVLRHKLRLSEAHAIQAYVEGLREDFARQVRILRPTTLNEARSIAKIVELNIKDDETTRFSRRKSGNEPFSYGERWRGSKTSIGGGGVQSFGQRSSSWSKVQPSTYRGGSVSSNPSTVPTESSRSHSVASHRMSPEEVEEHRAQNLCFYCHKKYSRDHDCPQRHKMALQLIELEFEETGDDGDNEGEVVPENEEHLQISLHAIQGGVGIIPMRIQGFVGKRPVQILVDNGATYDYIDCALARKLGWKGRDIPTAVAEIPGGEDCVYMGFGRMCNGKWQGRNSSGIFV